MTMIAVSLMRCKSPLDGLICQVDKHFFHSYGLYDSTTITQGLLYQQDKLENF